MRFRFDAHQPFQARAVAAVADAFGQALTQRSHAVLVKDAMYELTFSRTTFDLDHPRLLKNVRGVQHTNGLDPDPDLLLIRETVPTPAGDREVAFPNLSVEMESPRRRCTWCARRRGR